MEKSRMPGNVYEPLKTYFLKVSINCQGCKRKVKKTLRKVEGVYSVDIDTEQQAVMVRGNLDPEILVNKLKRRGKHAQLLFLSPNPKDQLNLNHQIDEEMLMMGDADYFQMTNSAELFGGNNYHQEVLPNLMRDSPLGYSNATGSMNLLHIGERSDDGMIHGPSLVPQYMNHQQFGSRPLDGFY